MARVTVEDCIDKVESPYELVLVAKERATQLNAGIEPTIDRDNDKNTVISLREIAEETISIDEMKNKLIEEYQTVSEINDEDLSIEQIDEKDPIDNIDKNEDQVLITDDEESQLSIDDNIDQNEDLETFENVNVVSHEENS